MKRLKLLSLFTVASAAFFIACAPAAAQPAVQITPTSGVQQKAISVTQTGPSTGSQTVFVDPDNGQLNFNHIVVNEGSRTDAPYHVISGFSVTNNLNQGTNSLGSHTATTSIVNVLSNIFDQAQPQGDINGSASGVIARTNVGGSRSTFTGTISGSTLTVSGVTGTVAIGQRIIGTGVLPATTIQAGSGATWTVNPPQSIGPVSMTGLAGRGTAFALAPYSLLLTGSTDWFSNMGAEVDIGIDSTSSAFARMGFNMTSIYEKTADGPYDAALGITGADGTRGSAWKNAIYLHRMNGGYPLQATGCVICTDRQEMTIATFADLSDYTISGNIFNFKNFQLTGRGTMTLGTSGSSQGMQLLSGATSGFTQIHASAVAAGDVTFQAASGTVALLENGLALLGAANTFTANQTFNGGTTTMGGVTQPGLLFSPSSGATTVGQLYQTGNSFNLATRGVADRATLNLSTGQFTFLTNIAATSSGTGTVLSNGGIGAAGAIWAGTYVATTPTTVGGLPMCNSGTKGARMFVTDATLAFSSANYGAAAFGGGTNNVPVTCDATSWKIGANDNVPSELMRKFA
jgi:hypothetical protein